MSAEATAEKDDKTVANKQLLKDAVHGHGHKAVSKRGLQDRLFTLMFSGFVYPQIWEDPEVDIEAMQIGPNSRIMTICSGGCNVLNYLTESPKSIHAIDLNPAHVALGRLKLAALKHLPDYESFFLFFGHADSPKNIENYDRYIAPNLDQYTRDFWEKRTLRHGRRINFFRKNLYKRGLLGSFIATVHLLSKLYGQDPRDILKARTRDEQKAIFDRTLGPLFDKWLVRKLCNMPVSLYGLGIPPAQFDELSEDAGGDMAGLLKARLERMACDFPIDTNYFAWQAFGRRYDTEKRKAIPRYLMEEHYETLKNNASRAQIIHASITDFLADQGKESFENYVFLDAQDWMTDKQLTELWSEVARTAAPNARVIFRTAGTDSPLTQSLPSDLLGLWDYNADRSSEAVAKDRSSIYGGFHTYAQRASQRKKAAA
ncbi:MAG: DUF3419 family protein [Alphaproteobacteria bacterium]|nr:DUF3419 family protein [Alphaproteobacteria bacterium]MCB9973993.1 DUF3419 family protein [Rhodospirillales bacterium]